MKAWGGLAIKALPVNMISSSAERKMQTMKVKETLKSLVNIIKFTAEPLALLLWGIFDSTLLRRQQLLVQGEVFFFLVCFYFS